MYFTQDKEELSKRVQEMQEQLEKTQFNSDEIERLNAKLQNEQMLKHLAINKLTEILSRKDLSASGKKNKASSADLKKKEKDCRRLQQELTQEREKYGQLSAKWQKDLQDLQVFLFVCSFIFVNKLRTLGKYNYDTFLARFREFSTDRTMRKLILV